MSRGKGEVTPCYLCGDEQVCCASMISSQPQPGGVERPGLVLYFSFGEESGIRSWDDARRFGFVSAGGGVWFSRTVRALPIGARVFVCVPTSGYVGFGVFSGEARRFDDTVLTVGVPSRSRDGLQRPVGEW